MEVDPSSPQPDAVSSGTVEGSARHEDRKSRQGPPALPVCDVYVAQKEGLRDDDGTGVRISMSGHMTPGRALKNEQFFAESNASIVREAGERRQLHVDVICECAQIGCVARIPMTAREYDEAHTLPRQFVVTPGHEILGVERVVRREAGYLVVEKFAPTG